MPFSPGQYATLWLKHGDRTVPRPYSIASSPRHPKTLEFYINLVSEGQMTPSLWDHELLLDLETRRPSTSVEFTGPKGRFLLDPSDTRDLVFIASGTGLAPFMSMVRFLNEESIAAPGSFVARRLCVVHGASLPAYLGYHQELSALMHDSLRNPKRVLAVTYLPTISRHYLDPGWQGLKGRAEYLLEDPGDSPRSALPTLEECLRGLLLTMLRPESHVVYACGHPGTVDNVVRILSQRGFQPDRDIRREKYYP
jgi:ferredoxin/flavodoxin---NADP+ reductase